MSTDPIKSPVGEIYFMAVHTPVTNKRTGKTRREVSVLFDSKKAADFISTIAKINPGIPVTAATYRGNDAGLKAELEKGKTKISAGTQFDVEVFDKAGEPLDEKPMFFPDSTGTVQMIVEPYTKSEKGGTINLVGVVIHSIEGGESSSSPGDREAKLARLRELAKQG